jgi:hypothetical protein
LQILEAAANSDLIQDDGPALVSICSHLEALPSKMVAEVELKHFLRLSGTKGHRSWRKLRGKLTAAGCVAEVAGVVQVCHVQASVP